MADSTTRKNLDIVIRARDETKKGVASASRGMQELQGTMHSMIAVAALANIGAQAGAAAFEMWGAASRRATAAAKADLTAMMDAEIEDLNASTRLLAGIPILGPQIQRALVQAFDIKSVQEWVAQIKEADASIQKLAESEAKLAETVEVRMAKMLGKSESEVMKIQAKGELEAIQKQIDEANKNVQVKAAQWKEMESEFIRKYSRGGTVGNEEETRREEKLVLEARRQFREAAAQAAQLRTDFADMTLVQEGELANQLYKEQRAALDAKIELEKNTQKKLFEVRQDALRAAGKTTEAEVELVRHRYAAERAEIKETIKDRIAQGHALLMADLAEKAALREAVGAESASPISRDLGVQQSYRLLRSAPGQSDPAWAQKQLAENKRTNDLLENLLKKDPIAVQNVELRS